MAVGEQENLWGSEFCPEVLTHEELPMKATTVESPFQKAIPLPATNVSIDRLSSDCFRFLEVNGRVDPKAVIEMISGKWPGCIFRNVVATAECDQIARNYEKLNETARVDGVPGRAIGPFHYKKTLDEYFEEVDRSANEIELLFRETGNPVKRLQVQITSALLESGLTFRAARNQNRLAGTCVARSWNGTGPYSLQPHEDVAQLLTKAQTGFEIQNVAEYTVIGANLCVQKDCEGANPKVWNLKPGFQLRCALGLEESGYPYPMELVDQYESVIADIHVGDFYLLNSSCIHAVTRQTTTGLRLTLSFLLGQIDNSTVIYWT